MTFWHYLILTAFVFSLGASIGSFVNVCICRLPKGESLVRPGSKCPRCRASILPRDNVPVLGWAILRGKCRACGESISIRYPLVEAGVGSCFALLALLESSRAPVYRELQTSILVVVYHCGLAALLMTSALIVLDRLAEEARPVETPAPQTPLPIRTSNTI